MRSGARAPAETFNLLYEIEATDPEVVSREHSAVERLILKHAMRSLGRRGYAATTLRGVAAEANVTAPLVSYYFESKEKLFLRIAEIVMGTIESEVARALERPLGFRDAIEAIARAQVALVERCPAAVEFMLSLLYGPQEGQPPADIEAMYEKTRARIGSVFEDAVSSGEFRPRAGMSVHFLVDQIGSLIHDYGIRNFRLDRLLEQHPERREEIEKKRNEASLDVCLDLFFSGAGEIAAPGAS